MTMTGIICGICFGCGWLGCMFFDYVYDKRHEKSNKEG